MLDLYNFDKAKAEDKADILKIFKIEFNNRIARFKKAEEYYNKPSTTDADVERTLNEFLRIHDELIKLANDYEKIEGYKLSYEIMTNGFEK